MNDKQQVINDLEVQINADVDLRPELKAKLVELVAEAKKDPTDDNLEALAVALETVADSEDYQAALSSIAALTARTQV